MDYVIAEEQTDTAWVCERTDDVLVDGQNVLAARHIRVRLKTPTQDGEKEIPVLSNLPQKVSAVRLSEVYLGRWRIEGAFQRMTCDLRYEIQTLAYRKAPLVGFTVAVVAYNVLSVVRVAMAGIHGQDVIDAEFSWTYKAREVASVYEDMMIALPEEFWVRFELMEVDEFIELLLKIAKGAKLQKYKKSRRKPKKKVEKINDGVPHKSTAKVLAQRYETN